MEEHPFKMKITTELIQSLESSFIYKDHKTKKQTPYRVKFNGKFITTKSKKTIWPSIGAAKNALLLHLSCEYHHDVTPSGHRTRLWCGKLLPLEFYTEKCGYNENLYLPRKFFSILITELEKQKIIEFIPV
jgi:hypothetical protein